MTIQQQPVNNGKKLVTIDIMRGIAILLVILVHTSQRVEGNMLLRPFADYGQMGVQLFFVASAFTLCYSMDARSANGDSLKNFYIRRFFRIAPSYYFGILLYYIITSINTTVWISNKNPIDIMLNILFLNGLFESANNSVVPGGWSIGTEMLFYLIFPFLFIAFKKLQGKCKYSYLILPICSFIVSLLIQWLFYTINSPDDFNNNSFFYYNLSNQLPVFCVGMSVYIAYKNHLIPKFKKSHCILFVLLFSFLSWYIMSKIQYLSFFYILLFPFVSSLSFVFIFIFLQIFRKIKLNFLSKMGVVSYSSYLLHFIFTFYLVNKISLYLHFLSADVRLIITYIVVVMLTYNTAKLFHMLIELNGIKLGRKIIAIENNKRILNRDT